VTNRKQRRSALNEAARSAKRQDRSTADSAATIASLFASGMQFAQAGRISDAVGIFRRILELAPDHAGSLFQMGLFAYRAGDNAAAEPLFLRAATADPKSVAAHFNLGRSRLSLGKYEEAVGSFSQVLDLDPSLAEARVCLAIAFQELDRNDEAASALRQAIAAKPGYAEAHMNLANLLKEQGKLGDAESHARRAIALAPGLAMAHRNLAAILQDQGLVDGAIKSFEAASKLAPNWPDPHSGLLFCLNYDAKRTAEAIAAEHLRRGKLWTGTPRAPDNFAGHDCAPGRRLRIGYVSGDFHRHPVGIFMSRILESHDPAQVETFAYSNRAGADAVTEQLQAATNHWRAIRNLSDDEVEAKIRSDGIDILVDLSGHVAANRLNLIGRRVAPVQVSYLGYVSTTGLAAMDYVLTDAVTAPAGSESLFSEAVVRLPHGKYCYAPPAYAPTPDVAPSSRTGFCTFGSFNHVLKLGPDVIALWSMVLKAVPESRLVLKWPALTEPNVRDRFIGAFEAHGIDSGRITFRGLSSHEATLREYGDIDIALDPFPHCGGLTTCEALWMGVPVVTLPRDTPVSRQSVSLLSVMDMPDLVANSQAEYIAIASALAADASRLAMLRGSLRLAMAASPLCDQQVFTGHLEAAFRRMWRQWCEGRPAASFDVAPG
jgi:protein O-GlcNAc transferase